MLRLSLTDEKWAEWEKRLREQGVYSTPKLRLVVEGILWRIRTGAPWRDMPTELGSWKSAYNQFNRWSKKGIWQKIFVGKARAGQRVEFYGFNDQSSPSAFCRSEKR